MLFTSVELVETQKKAKSKYKGKGQVNSNDCVADYVCTKEKSHKPVHYNRKNGNISGLLEIQAKITFLKIYRDINTGWYVNKSSIKPFWPYGI